MAKINFRQFKLFTDITQERTDIVDVSRAFANTLYTRGSGIVMHDLALRIYRSEGEMELTPEEANIIRRAGEQFCTPIFSDSINANLVEE